MPQVSYKLADMLDKMLSGLHDPVATIIENETARGFKVVRPGDTPWFRAIDWRAASIASINGVYARLVLLHAFQSGRGSMTRTIEGAKNSGLIPIIIDPTRELATMLKRRGWRGREVEDTFGNREAVWSMATAKRAAKTA